jgi:hypothetical protein
MHEYPLSLQAIYDAAAKVGRDLQRSPEAVFDPCGLILQIPPIATFSWCTPDVAMTFASTGGDSVHYSYLNVPGADAKIIPIVMTLPANDEHNFVVAEGFEEFLGLGFHVGWFALEQVVYEPEAAVAYFRQHDPDEPPYKTIRMKAIRQELKIHHVPLDIERLAGLTKKYSSYLVVPDEPL